ncbi:MAG: class I SAM-dependent methyltransferase [Rhodocyclaceae bacterium]|nr:class I SAM-dependent methyltransferase [Rhodocyclaceae bacterium]
MTTPPDHFSSQASSYARFRPSYPAALFQWIAERAPAHKLAWDVGCGNGQASLPLAQHFQRVLATDLSAAQIALAPPHPRIEFRVAPCDQSGLAEASCDAVTVAQALHWFDFAAFYAEVKRVLKPGGLLAAWTYQLLTLEDERLNTALMKFYHETLARWWPAERAWVDRGYQDIPFPFPRLPTPTFSIRVFWTLAQLVGYIGSWSAVQRCRRATGADPCALLHARLSPLWGEASQERGVFWPIVLLAGKKPLS